MLAPLGPALLRSCLPPLGAALAVMRQQQRAAAPCLFFHRGFCRFGDSCRYSHVEATALPNVLPFTDRSFASVEACASVPRHARVRVMTYNILADHLAHEHAPELYRSSPRYALEWGYRSKLIVREVAQYQPDLLCLQEVDRWRDLQQALDEQGYEGLYTKRTGDRRDGLAMFWRRDVFRSVKAERILFSQLGLKDNVAQVVLLQRRPPARTSSSGGLSGQKRGRGGSEGRLASPSSDGEPSGGDQPMMAVGNIHVLFNPRRGDIKLAQVRTLMERVRRLSEEAGGAPAVVCGDFNSAAGSPIYQYIRHGQLDLAQHERKRLSGQVESQGRGWPSLRSAFLAELQRAAPGGPSGGGGNGGGEGSVHGGRGAAEEWGWDKGELGAYAGLPPAAPCAEGAAMGAVLARMPAYNSLCDPYSSIIEPPLHIDAGLLAASGGGGEPVPVGPWQQQHHQPQQQQPAGVAYYRRDSSGGSMSSSSASSFNTARPSRGWTPLELQTAMGGPTAAHYQHQQQSHSFYRSYNSASMGGGRGMAGGSGSSGPNGSALLARCPLHVESAYAAVTQEPLFTTCHDKFIGCVDYIWFTPPPQQAQQAQQKAQEQQGGPGSSGAPGGSADAASGSQVPQQGEAPRFTLRPLSVLQPPPLQSLRTGMPCGAWPSDHVSLLADFALFDSQQAEQAEQAQQEPGGRASL